jgi:hypothetical protein
LGADIAAPRKGPAGGVDVSGIERTVIPDSRGPQKPKGKTDHAAPPPVELVRRARKLAGLSSDGDQQTAGLVLHRLPQYLVDNASGRRSP